MTFPWANTLLLAFIAAELVSGLLGLTSGGSEDREIFMEVHRVAGYGILVVLGWKMVNVVRSLRWPRRGSVRVASLALGVILAVAMGLGLWWSVVGSFSWWIFSGMSWHIYAGAALIPLLAWHAWRMTRGFPMRFWAERRLFLRASWLALAGFVGWQLAERATVAANLGGSERRFTGSYEHSRFSGNAYPSVSWLNDNPAPLDADGWRLRITGAVERPFTLRYAELADDAETTATLDCTGGWHSTQRWNGASVGEMVRAARPTSVARSVTFRSVTGYYRRFGLDDADGLILATSVTDERLSHRHGFPARLVAPDRRGFEWVKWVVEIEVSEVPSWWQPPLPVQ